VFAEQGEFCFGVIEIEACEQSFPTAGGVAGLAGFLELALVRINVATGAGREFHVVIAGSTAWGIGLVALFAGHLYVQAG